MDKVLSDLRRIAQTYPVRGVQDAVIAAVDEVQRLREAERLWFDRYYSLWSHVESLIEDEYVFREWAGQVNEKYRDAS